MVELTPGRWFGAVLLFSFALPVPLRAADGFVENAEQMVDQLLGGKKEYGLTRSFTVVEPETRAIAVRKKNKKGEDEIMVIEVPTTAIDPVARLKVEFDVGSANLRSSAYQVLGELGRALQNERVIDHRVCIKGHTDSDGDEDYNLGLSYQRAHSVQNFLQGALGVPGGKISVFGYGEAMPIIANSNNYNKQLNRRVEVSLNCAELNR